MRAARSAKTFVEKKPEEQDQGGERRIDHTRPVGKHAMWRVEPPRRHIVPRLSRKKIAHLHHAHGVVGVEIRAMPPDFEQARQPNAEIGREGQGEAQHKRQDLGGIARAAPGAFNLHHNHPFAIRFRRRSASQESWSRFRDGHRGGRQRQKRDNQTHVAAPQASRTVNILNVNKKVTQRPRANVSVHVRLEAAGLRHGDDVIAGVDEMDFAGYAGPTDRTADRARSRRRPRSSPCGAGAHGFSGN